MSITPELLPSTPETIPANVATIAYHPHYYQRQVHKSEANKKVVAAGRQSGKTVGAVAEESEWAMSAPKRWPDEKNPQFWWTTASYKTKGKAWRDFAIHVPREIIRRKHESETWFELWNGSRITFRSADGKDSLVSERLHGLVADEFGQYNPMVYDQLLGPMLATTGGPVILMGSTRGMNHFRDKYTNAARGLNGWASFGWRTQDSPYVSRSWLEDMKLVTPERLWRQEYLAEFLTDGGDVFRNVDNCISPPAIVNPNDYNVLGLDLARTHDWTVIQTFNSRGEWTGVRRVGHLDWSVQRLAVLDMYRTYKCKKIVLDATGIQLGGEAVAYDLMQQGCIVETIHITGEIKRALIENLMLRFDLHNIRIPQEAAQEFREFSVEQLPSGYERYAAPEGKHDDYVMAAALGMWGIRHLVGRLAAAAPPKTEIELIMEQVRTQRELTGDGQGGWYH